MLKGWKTLIFGGLITMLGGIQAADLATIVPAQYVGIALAGIGAIVMFLRSVTNTPVASSTK